MKKKLIKLREYWLNVSFTLAKESGDKDLVEACEYLEKTAMKMSENTPLPFDYMMSKRMVKRQWKMFFIEFMILTTK